MGILGRIILTILIMSFGGFCMGMIWGLYLGEKKNIVKLDKIKIPDTYKNNPPKSYKMKERWEYYRCNNRFYVPIVIDQTNYLVDGYTSYLIAEKEGIKKVEVMRR